MNRPRAFNDDECMNSPGERLRPRDSREGRRMRRRNDTMGPDIYVTAQSVGIGVMIAGAVLFGAAVWLKRSHKSAAELLRFKKKPKVYVYTEKDKDMLDLIHELSAIYDNTERYLNS